MRVAIKWLLFLSVLYLTELDCYDVLVALLVPNHKFNVIREVAAFSNLEDNILAWVDTRNPEVGWQ
jgi:hypothetical protein